MPLDTLHSIRQTLLQSKRNGISSCLRDISIPSHPAVSLTFEITAQPDTLNRIQGIVADYHRACKKNGRMKQIHLTHVPTAIDRIHMELTSVFASAPGTPLFIQKLAKKESLKDAPDPNAPVSLTDLRKKLLGK